MRKNKTKAEIEWLSKVASIGCIICGKPACIHHIRRGQGLSQRSDYKHVIPLCPEHHQYGGFGVAIHAGQKTWENKFGSETELLIKVYSIIGEKFED